MYEGPQRRNVQQIICNEHTVEKYIQWVTTLLLTIRVYYSFSSYWLPNLRNPTKFFANSYLQQIALHGHPRSSILVPIEIAYTTSYISFCCICQVLLYLYLSVCQSVFLCNYTVRTASMWRINFIINSNFVCIS